MSDENEIMKVVQIDDNDWFLQRLVHIVNSGNISFGITLNVGGFLVSGTLTGGKEYFEGVASDFAGTVSDTEEAEKIRALFAKPGELYSSKENQPSPSYVHIKDARFFNTNGNPIPGNRGVWWRGRLSEVDGFSLGSLSSENS